MNLHLPIALLAVLGTIAGPGVHAQAPTQAPVQAENPAQAVAPSTAPAWRSAFDGYQPFADQEPLPWRQANDTVQSVGGWRAYAREAAQPASAAASGARPGGAAGHRAHPMH